MATTAPEAFDALGEGRTSDLVIHVTLLQRGRVLQQLREQVRRRESYSLNSRRVSVALLGQQSKRPMSTRRLLLSTSETTASVGHDMTSLSPVGDVDTDTDTLVRSAVLALWTNLRLAMGFRRWREVAKAPTDLSRFGSDVDITIEARRILLAAEADRQEALSEAKTPRTLVGKDATPSTKDEASLVVSPRVLENAGVRLSRDELDLLTVWGKEIQAKTFRGVDDASICEAMRSLRLRTYQDGEPLFYEGETGEMFFIIFQGTVGVFVGMPAATKAGLSPLHRENKHVRLDWSQLGKRVFTYRTGDCFGETAMFSGDASRTASAVAVGPCEVCELHRDVYKRTLSKYHQQFFEQAQKVNFLQRVPLFRELPRVKLVALAEVLEKKRFHFGETLIVEQTSSSRGASSLGPWPRASFLILSGVVKLTESVEVPGQSHALTPAEAAASPSGVPRKKKSVAHMKIELQTLVSNEIVALEALLDPQASPAKDHQAPSYTATAASAHVDVYVLKESDARGFIGGMQSALGQKIWRQSATEAMHRQRRRKQTQQALLLSQQDAADVDLCHHARPVVHYTEAIGVNDSLDLAAAARESPRSGSSQHRPPESSNAFAVPGLQVDKQPSSISEGCAPYLPHLRATHLFPSSSLAISPRDAKAVSSLSSELSVVSSPKMLSSCVRKFLFEHSDTLSHDYVERLSHQFPAPPPQSLQLAGSFVMSKSQREDQRVLEHQLSKMYDSKMHWDAKKKDFVVATSTPTPTPSPRTGFLRSTPRCPSGNDMFIVAPPSQTPRDGTESARHASARRKSTFHQELRSTQQTARKLVESHLKRVGGPSKPTCVAGNNHSDGASGGAAFFHFFADS